ncbi:MAG: hypothetical protein H7A25_00930 [Leptospiraceae bacterium]|nr:hypothetical protein [Leptospiraceae bacterium]MCP5498439.1 hypothetical protein [Leptospiraceae bacterium]
MSSSEEGILNLQEGKFENAKNVFSLLLDEKPEDPDLISSYFISSYWDNRLDMILLLKEGKERGTRLVQMFDEFEKEMDRRNFPRKTAYEAITHCILSEASSHFRLAYQTEGISGLQKDVLQDLALCLIKTGDYPNALEISEYTLNFMDNPPGIIFFQAECLFHLGQVDKSHILFREGLLYDPDLLRFDIIKSEPLASVIRHLKPKFESDTELKEYIPVYCLERNLLPEIRDYSKEELQLLFSEMERLEENLRDDKEKYLFKVRCRMIQIGLTILDSKQAKINSDLCRKVSSKLNSIDPSILEKRNAGKIPRK